MLRAFANLSVEFFCASVGSLTSQASLRSITHSSQPAERLSRYVLNHVSAAIRRAIAA